MNRILVINVNWLGDVIFSTPVFKALRKEFSGARISCLAVPRVKPVLESCPAIDEIIVYDEKGKHRGLIGKCKLVSQLRQGHFDIAFLLHRSWTRALLVYLAGIRTRVGYDAKNRGCLLTHKVSALSEDVHRSNFYSHVIESYGVPVADRTCSLTVSPEAATEVEQMLREHGLSQEDVLIVVHAGGNWDLKRWPRENFAQLIHRFMNDDNNGKVKVVITGAVGDISLANDVERLSKSHPIVLAGKTDLRQLIALLQRADFVISADSGPLHMASCVGTRGIGIFGPTRPEITGPRGKGEMVIFQKDVGCNRAPCYYLECPDNVCMQAVTVDDVIEKVPSQFGKIKNHVSQTPNPESQVPIPENRINDK